MMAKGHYSDVSVLQQQHAQLSQGALQTRIALVRAAHPTKAKAAPAVRAEHRVIPRIPWTQAGVLNAPALISMSTRSLGHTVSWVALSS